MNRKSAIPPGRVFRSAWIVAVLPWLALARPGAPAAGWDEGGFCGNAATVEQSALAEAAGTESFPNYGRSRLADIQHVKIDLALDVEREQFRGTASTRFTPLNEGLNSLELDCVDLRVSDVATTGGAALDFDHDGKVLTIRFPSPLRAGQPYEIVVGYSGERPRRGMRFIHPSKADPRSLPQAWTHGEPDSSRNWFPCYDFPNERATTEVIATVDKPMTAISNGRLLGVEDAGGGKRRFHWLQDKPHVNYLVTLVAGVFDESTDSGPTPISYLVPPGEGKTAGPTFSATPRIMEFFERATGCPYPWDGYSQIVVEDFLAGGMENTGATTMNRWILTDELNLPDSPAEKIVAHELAHQWFGDLLTCRDWSQVWLNEGFATYFDLLWTEESKGQDEFEMRLRNVMDSALQIDSAPDVRPVVNNRFRHPGEMFTLRSYNKGAAVLHMIRRKLGDDLWWKAIRRYVATRRDQSVDTNDFLRAIEESTGQNLERLFDQWLRQPGCPKVRATYAWNDPLQAAEIVIEQLQPVTEASPPFLLEFPIAFYDAGGTVTLQSARIEKARETLVIPLDRRPAFVRIDPHGDTLMDLEFRPDRASTLKQLRDDPTVAGRLRSIKDLADADDTETLGALKKALMADRFWAVRQAAAAALGKMGRAEAFDALRSALAGGERDPRVRVAAIQGLEKNESKEDKRLLRRTLRDERAPASVRAASLSALVKCQPGEAREFIAEALKADTWREGLRIAALKALEDSKHEKSLDMIRDWAKEGRPVAVRLAALPALGRAAHRTEERAVTRQAREFLLEVLKEDSLQIRRAAIEGLGALGDSEALPRLRRIAETSTEWRLKGMAGQAVKQIADARTPDAETKRLRGDLEKMTEREKGLSRRVEDLESDVGRLTEIMQKERTSPLQGNRDEAGSAPAATRPAR